MGIIIGILILRPLKRAGLLIRGLYITGGCQNSQAASRSGMRSRGSRGKMENKKGTIIMGLLGSGFRVWESRHRF